MPRPSAGSFFNNSSTYDVPLTKKLQLAARDTRKKLRAKRGLLRQSRPAGLLKGSVAAP